jgi:hypothetical protein
MTIEPHAGFRSDMDLWGAHVPFSGWTVAVLAVGAALSLALGRRAGERAVAWACSLMSLTGVLALTLTPEGHDPPIGLAPCIPYDLHDLIFNIFHTGGGPAADALNVLLLVPLTACLVLAARRPAIPTAVALLLPICIELTQTVVPGRFCAVSDVVTNTTGGLLGLLVGYAAVRVRRRRSGRSLAPEPLDGAGQALVQRRGGAPSDGLLGPGRVGDPGRVERPIGQRAVPGPHVTTDDVGQPIHGVPDGHGRP